MYIYILYIYTYVCIYNIYIDISRFLSSSVFSCNLLEQKIVIMYIVKD